MVAEELGQHSAPFGTGQNEVAPTADPEASCLEVVGAQVGAGDLRARDVRKAGFADFKGNVVICEPAASDGTESVSNQFALEVCAVEVFGEHSTSAFLGSSQIFIFKINLYNYSKWCYNINVSKETYIDKLTKRVVLWQMLKVPVLLRLV